MSKTFLPRMIALMTFFQVYFSSSFVFTSLLMRFHDVFTISFLSFFFHPGGDSTDAGKLLLWSFGWLHLGPQK
jgi:hypothetical protein